MFSTLVLKLLFGTVYAKNSSGRLCSANVHCCRPPADSWSHQFRHRKSLLRHPVDFPLHMFPVTNVLRVTGSHVSCPRIYQRRRVVIPQTKKHPSRRQLQWHACP
eukprot:m.269295 g.269295  ORF g.269295 m.269295 type:complete len:105 (+) comp40534_c1_seq49:1249-1563(+)